MKLRTDCGTGNGVMAAMHGMGHLRRTKGLRAGRSFTEETGLVGGFTSLKALWNMKSLTQGIRFKWHVSGSFFAQLLLDDLDKV